MCLGSCCTQVLEIAAGTGRNLELYPSGCSVLLTDRSREMVEVLRNKLKKSGKETEMTVREAVAEQLAALETETFDSIVDIFGLCSVDNPEVVLQGCAQMLSDNGVVLLLEHGKGDWPMVNKLLDARASAHAREWGCWYACYVGFISRAQHMQVQQGHPPHCRTLGSARCGAQDCALRHHTLLCAQQAAEVRLSTAWIVCLTVQHVDSVRKSEIKKSNDSENKQ